MPEWSIPKADHTSVPCWLSAESEERVLKEHAYYTACFKEVNSDEDKSCYIKEKKIKEFFKNTYKYA